MAKSMAQQPKRQVMALALSLGTVGALLLSGAPLLAQALPPEVSPSSPASVADSDTEIYRQVQAQVAAARSLTQQGQVEAASAQLNQAIALAKSLQSTDGRDRALSAIGLAWLALPTGLEQAQAITQAMTYETLGVTDQLRVELEKALIVAYVQADAVQQAIALIELTPPGIQDQEAAYLIETLVNAGQLADALPLADRFIPAESYWRYVASQTIVRAYIAAEQYEAAQAFLQAHPFTDAFDQAAVLGEIALWAGRAGQLETANAIAADIIESRRAATLVELARLHHYRGQTQTATELLVAATQLPMADPNDPLVDWSAAQLIAQAYAELGQSTQAQQVIDNAAKMLPKTDNYESIARIDAYLAIGAIDRARAVLDTLKDDGSRYDGLIRVATAYSEQGQDAEAIALVNQIPDRALMPLIEYPDPKIELLLKILERSLKKGEFDLPIQIAKSLEDPATQVQSWVKIAAAYPTDQQAAAIAALDQALAIARTVERENVVIDRHFSYSKSNADLLKVVAEGYRSLNQSEQAIATIREALAALEAFRSDSPLALGGVREGEVDYAAIAQLARDWQQPDFYDRAISGLEKQLAESASSPAASETEIPGTLSTTDQILRLVSLTYSSHQAPSERHQKYLSQLADLRRQTTAPTEQLALLSQLIWVYRGIDQLAEIEEIVPPIVALTAQQPVEERDLTLTNLAASIAPIFDPILDSETEVPSAPIKNPVKAILSQISSQQAQVEALRLLISEAAGNNKTEIALNYFEDFLAMSEQSLLPRDRDNALINLTNAFVFRTADDYTPSPINPIQIAILTRIPQYISDPSIRASVAISIAPHLPPAESTPFYTALTETLAQVPNTYAKREMLWQALNYTINLKYLDTAEQLANSLADGYRQSALGWIKIMRSRP